MSEPVKLGEDVTLYCGDCLEILPTLAAGSVDAVVTDPPYNAGVMFGDELKWQEYGDWLAAVLNECHRLGNGNEFIFQSPKAIPYIGQLFDGFGSFAAVKNFAMMGYGKIPNAWDLAFYKCENFTGIGRNWFLSNTAGMLSDRVDHPTQKTVSLMTYILELYDCRTILDPFMGSGTTGVACVQTGRKFIGIEIDPNYFEIARKRISEAQLQIRMEI